jgi:hypothetical protein
MPRAIGEITEKAVDVALCSSVAAFSEQSLVYPLKYQITMPSA